MKRWLLLFLLFLSPFAFRLSPASAADYYAAPNGKSAASGSIADPWDLATAVVGGPGGPRRRVVGPGDTIWVRGGTYRVSRTVAGTYRVNLVGTSAQPIVIRGYQRERAIIDQDGVQQFGMEVGWQSRHVYLWGLEFTNSDRARTTTTAGSTPPIPRGRAGGPLEVYGSDCKIINCIIRDGKGGLGLWDNAKNAEAYGCISFNNGWHGPDRGHGHGLYTQNKQLDAGLTSRKLIRETILVNNFGMGLHAYGQGGYVENYRIEGLVSANNGSPSAAAMGDTARARNLFLGTTQYPCRGIDIQAAHLYHPPLTRGNPLALGYGSQENEDLTFQHSTVTNGAGEALNLKNWRQVALTDNVFAGPGIVIATKDGKKPLGYTWDRNQYAPGITFRVPEVTQTLGGRTVPTVPFSLWQQATGYDGSSGLQAPGESPKVFVRPNVYEPGRAHVIVYNAAGAPSVPVDLSALSLKDGQVFEIRNVQHWDAKPVYAVFREEAAVIDLSMTDTGVTQPVGFAPKIASTLPQFGVFLLLPR